VYHACLQSRSIFYQEDIAPASTHFSPKLESRGVRNGDRIIPTAIYFNAESVDSDVLGKHSRMLPMREAMQDAIKSADARR